jgi:hypothetical protein
MCTHTERLARSVLCTVRRTYGSILQWKKKAMRMREKRTSAEILPCLCQRNRRTENSETSIVKDYACSFDMKLLKVVWEISIFMMEFIFPGRLYINSI